MAGVGVTRVTDCPVCLGTFKDPRVLPCGHTFCLSCITEHGRSKGSDPDCPNCRTKFQIPSSGFEGLPKNYSLNSMLDETTRVVGASKAKVTKGSCKKHNGEELVLYCLQCNVVICLDCMDEDHQQHNYCKINRFANEARTQLEGYVKSIKPILSQVTSQKAQLQEKSKKFCDLLDVTELAINKEYEKNKRLLDDHRRLLVEELSNEKQRVTTDLKMKADEIETEQLSLASFNTRIEEMLQGADEATTFDIVYQYKDFKEIFQKLKQTQPLTMGQVSVAGIEFIPGDFKEFISGRGNIIGRLQKESDSRPKIEESRIVRRDLTPSSKEVDHSLSQRVPIDQDVWYYLECKHPAMVYGIAKQHLCISRVVCERSNEGITHNLEVVPYVQDDSNEAKKHVNDVLEEFAQLYQKVSEPGIVKESIKLPLVFNQVMPQQLIAQLEEMGVFFLISDGPSLIGPYSCIQDAKQKVLDFISGRNNSAAAMRPTDNSVVAQASVTDRVGSLTFKTCSGLTVHVSKGDLVHQSLDAIVNPANERLGNGGGAARAIAKAAGYKLQRECDDYIRKNGKMEIASVTHTTAGNLQPNIKYVIHAVGPRKSDGKDDEELLALVKLTVFRCINYANEHLKVRSLAIPAISSGIYGVPIEIVGRASFEALTKFDEYCASSKNNTVREIHFLNMDEPTFTNMKRIFQSLMTRESSVDSEQFVHAKSPASGHSHDIDGGHSYTNKNRDDFEKLDKNQLKDMQQEKASGVAGKKAAKADDNKRDDDDNQCIICMDDITDKKELPCKHKFCRECIDEYFSKGQPKCPSCGKVFDTPRGDQPRGTMTWKENSRQHLAGYNDCGAIEIDYSFNDGRQGDNHPSPGQPYRGTHRTAFLPANKEGREVLRLLKRAFDARLVFTVGLCNVTGRDNVVIWNDIHHKTSPTGQYGYPDPTYLNRVKQELAAKGIL